MDLTREQARAFRHVQESNEQILENARKITKSETDMNSLSAIKRTLNAFRIRLESKDYKNALEETCMKARVDELYERCRILDPEGVAEYERFVRNDIRTKAKRDVKKLRRKARK